MTVIVPREHWGSKGLGGRPMGTVSEVILHHFYRPDVPAGVSASYERQVLRGVEQYHIDEFYDGDADRGGGTGYQFIVFPSERVYEGRGLFRTGAHTKGRNSKSISICFAFDGDQHEVTPGMWEAARACVDRALDAGALTYEFRVRGHHDYASWKSCPGVRVYPNVERLREPQEEPDMPLTDEDVERVALAVRDLIQPDKGLPIGRELDALRRDVRAIGEALEVDTES